jgi:hypothetical protein
MTATGPPAPPDEMVNVFIVTPPTDFEVALVDARLEANRKKAAAA